MRRLLERGWGSLPGEDLPAPSNRRESFLVYGRSLIWLALVALPLIDGLTRRPVTVGRGIAMAGVLVLAIDYLALVVLVRRRLRCGEPSGRGVYAMVGLVYAIALTLTLTDSANWGFLFTYGVAIAALIVPGSRGIAMVLASATVAVGASVAAGADSGTALGIAASTVGIGLLMVSMRNLRERNLELIEARAELARLAVAEERQRFARDLHDLLGHSLSVIALKAELAGRLLPVQPEQAAHEVAELEQVARTALGEVREAVSGYRELTLDGELAGARVALSAAGIAIGVRRDPVPLDPDVEAVLAWAVREGATNVIRHSGAQRCTFSLHRDEECTELEVIDDGVGYGHANGSGNGLNGLAERARAVRGKVEAGSRDGRGYRLAVSIPASRA